jgi:hypothetical protein
LTLNRRAQWRISTLRLRSSGSSPTAAITGRRGGHLHFGSENEGTGPGLSLAGCGLPSLTARGIYWHWKLSRNKSPAGTLPTRRDVPVMFQSQGVPSRPQQPAEPESGSLWHQLPSTSTAQPPRCPLLDAGAANCARASCTTCLSPRQQIQSALASTVNNVAAHSNTAPSHSRRIGAGTPPSPFPHTRADAVSTSGAIRAATSSTLPVASTLCHSPLSTASVARFSSAKFPRTVRWKSSLSYLRSRRQRMVEG